MSSILELMLLAYDAGPLSPNKTFRAPIRDLQNLRTKFEEVFEIMQIVPEETTTDYKIARWSIEILSKIDLEDIIGLLAVNSHLRLSLLGLNGRVGHKSNFLSTQEVMVELNIKSRQTIVNMIGDGRLKAIRPGREYQILRRSVEARKNLMRKKPKIRVD